MFGMSALMLAGYSVKLLPIVGFIIIINIIYMYFVGRWQQKIGKGFSTEIGNLTGYLAERIRNLTMIKSFVAEKKEYERGIEVSGKLYGVGKRYTWLGVVMGSFIQNYGEEGVHWELGDDGLPHFTDEVLNNPDYQPNEMISLISDMFNTSYYMWVRENDMYEPETVEGCDRWMESGTGEWVMPHVTLTVEESETYSRYLGDIQTYVDEFTTKVINGVMELNDTTWNEYVSWLKASGIEECMAIYQSALDRYLAR
jgi:ABC-type multidrug transport system fused ATPase/permease subunit